MSLFLAKRLFTFVLTLVGASLLIFLALEVLPGDPALVILGVDAPESAVAALRLELGLEKPLPQQYWDWVGGLMVGRFGTSYSYSVSVLDLISARLAVTIPLAVFAMILSVAFAFALGILAAVQHNKGTDVAVMGISQLGISIPNFWLALILIMLFAVDLHWFSAGGFPGWAGFWPGFKALVLPAIALATVQGAILARFTRSAILDTIREDYVRTARAKGLTRTQALLRHVLRNAMIPLITIMGLQFANLLAGTIIVENVFSLPGIGRLLLQAITQRDLVIVRDLALLLAAMVIVVNFLVDVLYSVIDPRLTARDI
jgi:peptide/nickel transport system permease protein